jgi:uncharacterized membrane protein
MVQTAAARAYLDKVATTLLDRSFQSLSASERRVILKIAKKETIARDVGEEEAEDAPFWDRLADRVATVGGSWGFIFGFGVVLVGWMLLNSEILKAYGLAFDPYPYIFLNLMLSMVAALQAPIIMMSQNRHSAKDRMAAQHDYEVNLRAELEIMRLHEKLDMLRDETAHADIEGLRSEIQALAARLPAAQTAAS